jgi:probable phosphoglycerate mutase
VPERLLLIRHGLSTWNVENRWQGWADCQLSADGEAQAAEAAARLAGAGLTGVASSDLLRARRTAEIMSTILGLGDVLTDSGLREYDVGDWQGHTREEIAAKWPELFADWRNGHRTQLPGGEPRHVFEERVLAALERLGATEPLGAAPLVVTHGGCIRVVERHLGLANDPVPNLSGRWVEVGAGAGGELGAGERFNLPDAEFDAAKPL